MYRKSCLTFQLKTPRRSASMSKVKTARSVTRLREGSEGSRMGLSDLSLFSASAWMRGRGVNHSVVALEAAAAMKRAVRP